MPAACAAAEIHAAAQHSYCFAPQGCSFFMTRISLTCTSMAYLLFFFPACIYWSRNWGDLMNPICFRKGCIRSRMAML